MADSSRVIELVFAAVDQATPTIKSIGGGIEDFGKGIDDIVGPITEVSDKLLLMEGAIGAITAAFGAFAVKEAVEFQAATLDLQKVLSDTDGDIKQFQQTAIDLSNTFGVSSSEVLQSAANFKQAGFSVQDAFALTRAALEAVNISELSAGEASEALIRILKGFNAPATDVTRVLDILNEVSNHFAASTTLLSDAVARSSPIAKQAGFSYEELAGTLTPMIEVFQDSEKTSRAFNSTLQRLITDNPDVVNALQQLKVSQFDLNGALRPGKDILHDVEVAFGKLPGTTKPLIAQLLAGTDEAGKMVIAFDGLAKVSDVTNTALHAAGSAEKEFETRIQGLDRQFNIALVTFKNAATLIGTELVPGLTDLTKAGSDVGLAFQQIVKNGSLNELIGLFNNFIESLARTAEGLAKALPDAIKLVDFSPLTHAITGLVDAVTGFNNLDLTKPKDLAEALQFLVNLTAGLTNFTAGFVEGMRPVVSLLVSAAGAAGDASPKVQEFLGHIGGAAQSIELLTPAIDKLGTALKGVALILPLVSAAVLALTNPAVGIPLLAIALPIATGAVLGFATAAQAAGETAKESARNWTLTADGILRFGEVSEASATSVKVFDATTKDSAANLDALQKALGLNNDQFNELIGWLKQSSQQIILANDGVVSFVERTTDAGKSTEELGKKLQAVGEDLRRFGIDARDAGDLAAKGITAAIERVQQVTAQTDFISGWDALDDRLLKIIPDFSNLGSAATDAADQTALAMSKTFEETLKAEKQINDIDLAWAKLEQEDRNLLFKLEADIAIAQIQQGTELVKAAFESINEGIKSTGDTLTELAKIFAEVSSGAKGSEIEGLLREEDNRRKQEFELQKELEKSQIQYLNAVTDRLNSGDATIQIDTTGVEPILRELLFSLMKQVQIQASSDAQLLLLGLT